MDTFEKIRDDLISADEAADIICCNSSYIRRLCQAGRLQAKKFGSSWVVYRPSAIDYITKKPC